MGASFNAGNDITGIQNDTNNSSLGVGGDGGHIVIIAKTITGGGQFNTNGGDGSIGGKGGTVTMMSDESNFNGRISANAGKSRQPTGRKWWENTWIQLIMFIASVIGILVFIQSLNATK